MTTATTNDMLTTERDLNNGEAVRKRVLSVISKLKGRNPAAVAGRAQLRSAIGKSVGDVPAIWAFTLESGPEALLGNEATKGERAVHVALTLWALHQGSHDTPMHFASARGGTIGSSVRRLAVTGPSDQNAEAHPIYRRLCAMIAAQTFDSLSVHARGLINLLSSADIQVDYGRLAQDLYNWQNPRLRSRVIRQWGRDFARTPRTEDQPPAFETDTNDTTSTSDSN